MGDGRRCRRGRGRGGGGKKSTLITIFTVIDDIMTVGCAHARSFASWDGLMHSFAFVRFYS